MITYNIKFTMKFDETIHSLNFGGIFSEYLAALFLYSEYLVTNFIHQYSLIYSVNCLFFHKGNILSIIILLKPASTNEQLTKYLNERNQSHHNRRSLGSFEHKLASFYAYLTALSFCDLFSCIFSILNMLEYIPPPYLDWSLNSEQYREFYLSLSVYTHPIATTLQVSDLRLFLYNLCRCCY